MASLLVNNFNSWALNPDEFRSGYSYNDCQIKVIQNLISEIALEKISITYDPLNPVRFAQQEAVLRGQIDILNHLLSQAASLNATPPNLEGE